MFKKKEVERICGNCKLFNAQRGVCSIVILMNGERQHVPVDADDPCFFDDMPGTGQGFIEDIKEVKFWVENEKGEKTDGDGIVKMEYPEGFFGEDA